MRVFCEAACLYVHEIEGFAVRRVEVLACTEGVVTGVLHGEPTLTMWPI